MGDNTERLLDNHRHPSSSGAPMRTLTSLLGNSQKLDGGAMFGNAPRAMWSQWLARTRHIVCRWPAVVCWCARTMAAAFCWKPGLVLFCAGSQARYGVVEDGHVLLDNLAAAGCSHEDIDVVILSHLHFDHVGGLLAAWDGGPARLLFPKAQFVVSRSAWQRARRHMRATARPLFLN
jgi:glyoxylase-like metal-dependent hydrolase (beta-lactamase superfamily II)